MHGVQEDVKMLETHSISNHQIDLVQDGFNGIEQNHALHFTRAGLFLGNAFRQPIVRKQFPAD